MSSATTSPYSAGSRGCTTPYAEARCWTLWRRAASSTWRPITNTRALLALGRSGEDIFRAYMDDRAFNAAMLYQAEMHAKNGGKGFFYTFEKGYDGDYAYLGAAHAADCNYMFGTFDGEWMFGTDEEVELSRRFQRMIANFCKTGPRYLSHVRALPSLA